MSAKQCNNCVTANREPISIPYFVHESAISRIERIIKRQYVALIVAVCMLCGCNIAWLCAWTAYDYTSTTEETVVEAVDGIANYIGNNVDIVNGENNRSKEDENTP